MPECFAGKETPFSISGENSFLLPRATQVNQLLEDCSTFIQPLPTADPVLWKHVTMSGKQKIKLTYFNAKGRAEISRLILAAAGKEYEDERIDKSQWESRKPNAKFNCLPNLTYNGKSYGQSMAIAAFLAREFGLYGKDNVEALRVDEVINVLLDLMKSMMQLMFTKEEDKKAEAMKTVQEDIVKYFTFLEKLLKENGSNGFFVGSKLSWADLCLFDNLERVSKLKEDWATHFPEIKKLQTKVGDIPSIKKYLSSRPQTEF